MHTLRGVADEARWNRDAVQRAAMEERDLIEVDIAVVPRRAFGTRHTLGRLGQKIADVDTGGFHEQMHHGRQVHAVGRHDVVVLDVEGEGEVVALPTFDVERIVFVEQRGGPDLVDRPVHQPHLIFGAVVVVDGLGIGNAG